MRAYDRIPVIRFNKDYILPALETAGEVYMKRLKTGFDMQYQKKCPFGREDPASERAFYALYFCVVKIRSYFILPERFPDPGA